MFISSLFIAIWVCFPSHDEDRSPVVGPPCVSFFSTDLIGQTHRIFCVECDRDGLIYLAYPDADLVIVYDGVSWQRIEVESPLCLTADSQGTVWVGQAEGIGYLKKDRLNQISYQPHNPGFRSDDLLHFGFAFGTENGARIGNGRLVVEIDSRNDEPTVVLKRAEPGETFVGIDGKSLITAKGRPAEFFKIVAGQRISLLKPTQPDISVECAVELNDGTHVFATDGFKNLRVLKNSELEFFSNSFDIEKQTSGLQWFLPMPGNRLGAVEGDIFTCYSSTGETIYRIADPGSIRGKVDRFGMFRDGRVWLTTSEGFALTDNTRVASCWPVMEGVRPATFDLKVIDDNVFVTGDQGLFQISKSELEIYTSGSDCQRLPYACGSIERVDEQIICATSTGLYSVADDGASTRIGDGFFWDMYLHRSGERNLIFVRDQYARLFVFDFEDGQAKQINKVELPASGQVFHAFAGDTFLIKQENCKARVMQFPNGFDSDPVFRELPEKFVVERFFKFREKLLLVDENEIVETGYSNGELELKPSPYFQRLKHSDAIANTKLIIDCGSEGVALVDREYNFQMHAWEGDAVAEDPFAKFHFGFPFSLRVMQWDQQEKCLWTMVGPNLLCLDPHRAADESVSSVVNIQMDASPLENGTEEISLQANAGTSFQFAVPFQRYLSETKPQYQYKLEGNDDQWSEWSESTNKEYTNLPGGDYQFFVRARLPSGKIFESSTDKFSVAVPWYMHSLAKVFYGCLFFGLILVVSRIRVAKLKSDNEQMEKLVQKRTAEIQKKSQEVLEKTAQLHAAQRKSEAERLASFDTLVAGITHDFNNLLTVVSANNEMMLAQGDEHVGNYASNSLQAVESAIELCKELSAFSDSSPAILEPTNISNVIRSLSELVSRSVPANVAFQLCEIDQECFALADDAQLKRAVLNLVVNAGEAAKSVVRVDVYKKMLTAEDTMRARYVGKIPEPGEFVVIQIGDDGIGLDQKVISRIFDPFFSTKKLGRGLGLAIVLKIVGRHNGVVFVDSGSDGTRLKICLPISKQVANGQLSTRHPEIIEPIRILLVDDDENVLKSLELLLRSQNHYVISVDSAQQGIDEVINGAKYDLIIVDVSMPDMTGPEMAAELFETHPELPILLISGFSENLIGSEMMRRSNLAFLMKPFSTIQLNGAIKNLLQAAKNDMTKAGK